MNFLLALVCLCAVTSVSIAKAPILIVISLDALMFSQLNSSATPIIHDFYTNGVHCPRVKPVFPTKTPTNHFSIATGLYAKSHGVYGRSVYDRNTKETISVRDGAKMFKYKEDICPIWTLNEIAGGKSAVSMWFGCQFEYRGINPHYYELFDGNAEWRPRIDKIIRSLKKDGVDFVMFYSEQPDRTEHRYTADSIQTEESLQDMDEMVGYLIQELKRHRLSRRTDIIILSDHGMSTVSRDESYIINLKNEVDPNLYTACGDSAVMQIVPNNLTNTRFIYNAFERHARSNGHFRVFLDDDLPANWHVNNPQRFGPITVVADPGYGFDNLDKYFETFGDYVAPTYGYHGYDNEDVSMQATFLANGPRFKKGVEIESFELVHYYHLFARLLGIQHLIANEEVSLDAVDKTDIWEEMLIDGVL